MADAATAPNFGNCCRCGKGERRKDAAQGLVERVHGENSLRNGTESRVLLPLWKRETEERCRTGAAEMVHEKYSCRNGTESRVLLPLWKRGTEGRCRTGAVERVHGESGFRNGTETWVLLPLWKREAEGRCRTGVCGEGTWGKRLPQRHRIAGFAAVVERRTDNMAGRSRYK